MSEELAPQPSPVSIEEAIRIYRGRGYHVEHPEDGVYLLAKGGVQQVWTEETLREVAAKLVNGGQQSKTPLPPEITGGRRMATTLPIDSIIVGDRRREDMGDLDGLAESIKRYGLLHPVVVDADMNMVAGGRRLAACKTLGWSDVPVRMLDSLTEAERQEIELEENLRRKDLTAYERSKTMVRLAETAAEVLQQESEIAPDFLAESAKKAERGRPPKPDAETKVAERIGVGQKTLNEAKRHAATADTYPVMQRPEWKQYHVLEAKERLEKLPEPERPKAAQLINQPAIPPKDAIKIIGNLADMPPKERAEVFQLQESPDSRDRSLALTRAAKTPPMPDPRIFAIKDAIDKLQFCIREFPNDPHTPAIQALADQLAAIRKTIREEKRA